MGQISFTCRDCKKTTSLDFEVGDNTSEALKKLGYFRVMGGFLCGPCFAEGRRERSSVPGIRAAWE